MAQLALALSRICVLQQLYGKTADELETLVEGFSWMLADYPMPDILNALVLWTRANKQMATPSDINNILNPPKQEWKPDWAFYVALKRKIANEGYFVWGDEKAFLRRCEQYTLERMKNHHEPDSEDEKTVRQFAIGTARETHLIEAPKEQVDHNWEVIKAAISFAPVETEEAVKMPVYDRAYFDARKTKPAEE